MAKFFSLFLSGGVSGAIYSLLAIGVVLNYTTSRIFNFGHAATAFASAYLFFQLNSGLHWSVLASGLTSIALFAPAAGFIWDRLVFRRLIEASEAARIVASVGVLIVMPAAVVWATAVLKTTFGVGFIDTGAAFSVGGLGPNPPIQWKVADGFIINSDQVIVLAVGIVAFGALWALLRFTSLGLKMRASVDSPVVAQLRGVNTKRMSMLAWVMSFTVAGLAGVLAAPFPGPFGLSADNYTFALFVAGTAAIIAGLRSLPVAFSAGLLLGAGRNLAEGYLDGAHLGRVGRWIEGVYGLRASFPYWVLFIALIVLGKERNRRIAGTSAVSDGAYDYLDDLSPWRKRLPWAVAGIGLLIYSLGLADNIWRAIVLGGLALAIVFLSFTVMTGIGGMVSLAQVTFAGVGALTAGMALSHGWPFLPAMIAGTIASAVLGLIVALPALRLGGLLLTLATLALALLGSSVLFNIQSLANGTVGWKINRPKFGGVDLANDRVLVCILSVVVLFVSWMVSNLQRSASGRAMIALRSSPPAAAASAVPATATKLTLFVLSAAIAGAGGVFVAMVSGTARGTSYLPVVGFIWLASVVVFGAERPHGAIVAGLVSVAMPRILSRGMHIGSVGWGGTTSAVVPQLLFGLGAIALASQPQGILVQVAEGGHRRRAKRRAVHRATATPTPTARPETTIVRGPGVSRATATATAAISTGRAPILELRSVHAGYGSAEILHGIDLVIEEGSVFALLGANGAGKSTLCSVVAGLIPVTSGSILFDGHDITRLSAYERARLGLLLVPESRGIFPSLTVDENLRIWLDDPTLRSSVYERFPNLGKRCRVPAGNLSGGEQQMLSLGPLIARSPKLLVADEPTLGLAMLVSDEIIAAFGVLRDEGTSLVLVEEKARKVLSLADTVGALSLGRLQWVQAAIDVDDDRLSSAYLGQTHAIAVP